MTSQPEPMRDDERAALIREATHLYGDPEGMADPGFMEMVRPGYTASQTDDAVLP